MNSCHRMLLRGRNDGILIYLYFLGNSLELMVLIAASGVLAAIGGRQEILLLIVVEIVQLECTVCRVFVEA